MYNYQQARRIKYRSKRSWTLERHVNSFISVMLENTEADPIENSLLDIAHLIRISIEDRLTPSPYCMFRIYKRDGLYKMYFKVEDGSQLLSVDYLEHIFDIGRELVRCPFKESEFKAFITKFIFLELME